MSPAHPSKNKHHTRTWKDEQDWYEDTIGRGPGDPDYVGHYPGQEPSK